MTEHRVSALPYRIGSSVSSVELLLDARTAAESAAVLASRQLTAALRLEEPLVVKGVVPGPVEWESALRFVVEAPSGALGALFVDPSTIGVLADLIMGGRGIADDGPPSALELKLFAERLLEPMGTLIDAVAPGRPAPIALVQRDFDTPARSLVVQMEVACREEELVFWLEVLAHHLSDDTADADATSAEAVCSDVPLEITFKFAPAHLKAHEVARLAPGDVICLEHERDEPVVGVVDGRALVKGRVGTSKQRAAVEVVDLIEGAS